MKFEDFKQSKWVKAAKDPRAESRLMSAFPKWKTHVKNSILITKSGELWNYFISDKCSATDKLLVMGALIYLISPIDLVPDYIPVIGWLDDVGVATAVLAYLNGKLDDLNEIENTSVQAQRDLGNVVIEEDPFADLMKDHESRLGNNPYSLSTDNTVKERDPYTNL